MNDRISKQRELIAKKEGKFYTNTKDFQDRIKALPFEAGQNVWLQYSDSRKYEEAVIREKCKEPNSYMVQIPATGQCFRRNSNFIKPRQSEQNSVSTDFCCDIGQTCIGKRCQDDIFPRIELFPLSSCQVIILITRMTFNCSTSCLMS